jgi:hypothetical protein
MATGSGPGPRFIRLPVGQLRCRRADLIRADADGVRVDVRTGGPVAWEEREEIDLASWARQWLSKQWKRLEPKTRKSTAEALRWMVERSVRPGSMPITEEMHKELMEWLCDPTVVATGDLRRSWERSVPMVSTVLDAGDELLVIGQSYDVGVVRRVAAGRANEPGVHRRRVEGVEGPPDSVDAGTSGP